MEKIYTFLLKAVKWIANTRIVTFLAMLLAFAPIVGVAALLYNHHTAEGVVSLIAYLLINVPLVLLCVGHMMYGRD